MKIVAPTDSNLAEAANALRNGKLVVMPTETVYGLAGAIESPEAVRQIFATKQRPASNPLIVHVSSRSQLEALTGHISEIAERLMNAFWPGPLTLVFQKTSDVADEVTAGGETIAVRMPAHPVARKLIDLVGLGLAAPSANMFMHLSPTRAEDVSHEIGDRAEMVIDGGPCEVGLESTVLDCSSSELSILRFGRVNRSEIEAVAGHVSISGGSSKKSPGQHPRHYAPNTKTRVVDQLGPKEGGLIFGSPANQYQIQMPAQPRDYGSMLYAALHRMDQIGLSEILIEAPPKGEEWFAIWDRIERASTNL